MDELEISGKRFISTRLAAKLHKYHSDYIGQLIRGKKIAGQKVGRSWYVDAESLEEYFKNPKAPEAPKQILSVEPIRRAEEEKAEAAEEAEEAPAEPEPSAAEEAAPEEVAEAVEESEPEAVKEEVIEEKEIVAEALPSFRRPLRIDDGMETSPVAILEEIVEEKVVEERQQEPVADEIEAEPIRDTIHIPIRKAEAKKKVGLRYVEDEAFVLPELDTAARKKTAVRTMRKEMEEAGEESDADVGALSGSLFANAMLPVASVLALGAVVFAVVALSSLFVNSTTTIEAGKAASAGYSLH
ncbi:MAG TPA: hypothetical protein VHD37_02005 [Candidatus Paceibacterota bacterium]|nr:hypothetical protein [Candidatus Paceibacterota bacterium]